MSQLPMDTVAPSTNEDRSIIETFTLQVVSPSVGVNGPLSFPQLPTATTIKQLKERIREALPIRPPDENQRLIHRGRLLARETETMVEIFGQDTLKNSDSQTLHLVLRPSTTEIATRSTSPLPQNEPHTQSSGLPPPPAPSQNIRLSPFPPDLGIDRQTPATSEHSHAQSLMHSIQRLHQLRQEGDRIHQELLTHRSPVFGQPPTHMASFQNAITQRQHDRAAMGMQGAQQTHQNVTQPVGVYGNSSINPNSIVQRPDHTTTYTQEGVGPNGERWQVTVNETTTALPTTSFPQARTASPRPPVRDIQNIVQTVLRAADANAAQQARQVISNSNAQLNIPISSGSHGVPTTLQPSQSGLSDVSQNPPTIGSSSGVINRPSSALSDTSAPIHTPATSSRTSSQRSNPALDVSPHAITESGPIVYILSSPTGPRALLINRMGSGIEAFFTPRQPLILHGPNIPAAQNPIPARIDAMHRYPEYRNRREARIHRHARRQAEGLAGAAAPAPAHPQNPNAGAVAAQIWPHIWLIARLMGFVWFFTSGNSSWWRTIMVSSLALIVFIANTGIFNGIAEQIWGPIRRHLEALIPLAGPNGPRADAPAPVNTAAPVVGQAEDAAMGEVPAQADPNPAQVTERLIEQRRLANGGWFWALLRRVEHATLLFLASLIPGVGERHIAARAAEENIAMEAERQRREAENVAANDAPEGDSATAERGSSDAATTGSNGDFSVQAERQATTGHNVSDDGRGTGNNPQIET